MQELDQQQRNRQDVNDILQEMGALIGLAHRIIVRSPGIEASTWRVRYAGLRVRLLPGIPAGMHACRGYVDRHFWQRA